MFSRPQGTAPEPTVGAHGIRLLHVVRSRSSRQWMSTRTVNLWTMDLSSEENSAAGVPKAKSGANGRGTREDRYRYLKEAIEKRLEMALALPAILEEPRNPAEEAPAAEEQSMDIDADDGVCDSGDEWYAMG
ncbi:hypothetical protein C8R46DRAFT_1037756 [Mycena filopes]|nr:hypothetical protein C8R46DRAFT_1037756 [Mycena filopes]